MEAKNLNDGSQPALQQADVSRSSFLPFKSIDDLVRKVEKIKAAHIIQQQTFRHSLNEHGIKYTELGEYGVAIDIGGLSDSQLDVIRNNDTSLLKEVYAQCGVLQNCG